MSFDQLVKSDYRKKTQEVKFTVGDNEVVFTATEISALERLSLAVLQHGGKDFITMLVVMSIRDSEGKAMTAQQAMSLPDEYATAFFQAAMSVNYDAGEPEKN